MRKEFVRGWLPPLMKDSTIADDFSCRLESKGLCEAIPWKNEDICMAVRSPAKARRCSGGQQVIDRYGVSVEQLLTGMIDSKLIDRHELAKLLQSGQGEA